MSFRRENDRLAKLSTRQFNTFRGSHYGFGKCDQPDAYAFVCDLMFLNEKAELRDGIRKNSKTGYPASITALFNIGVGGESFLGVVSGGVLNVYPIADIIQAVRQYYTTRMYYTVREVRSTFTVSSLTAKTVNEIITGRQ